MPSPAYLPDPNKWINTSSSKPKAPQRPLVAFRHGFPTPPTSVPRNVKTNGNGASAGQVRERQTTLSGLGGPGPSGPGGPSKLGGPSGLGERSGLGMFTPPPTTGECGTRRLGHILDSGSRGSPAPRRDESKLRVRADDYWNSDGEEDGEGHGDEPEQSRTGTAGSSKPVSYLLARTRPGAPVKTEEKKRTSKSTSKSKGNNKEDKSAAVLSAFSSGELSDLPAEYMTDYEQPPPSRPAAPDRAGTPTVVLTPAPAPTPHPHPLPLAASRPIPSSLTPSTQPRPVAPRHAPRPFSGTPVPAPGSASAAAGPTPPEHSPRPLTPVPKNVLAIHRQLCGQDPAQLERVHSPWRRQTSAQRLAREDAWREEDRKMREERKRERERTLAAKPEKPDRKAQVDERVRNRSLLLRGSDGVKRTRSLVDWDESEGSSPKRMRAGVPLTQLRPNSLVMTRSRPSKERAERSRALHLHMAMSGEKQATPNPSIPSRSAKENPSAGQRALDLASKSRPKPLLVDPTANLDDSRPNHAATPRIPLVSSATVAGEPSSPAPPSDPPLSSTPKKSPTTGHHTITPPKTNGMCGQAHHETLFAFPPPPQPNFKVDPAPPRRAKREFRPVDMQAETLLTWSLGPGVAGPKSIDEEVLHSAGQAGSEQDEGVAGASEPRRWAPVEVTPGEEAKDLREKAQEVPRRYSDSDQSESASLAPSVYSESFPRLLSSPTATRTSMASAVRHSPVKAARPANQVAATAQSGNGISMTPMPIPPAPPGWAALHQGILSARISAPVPPPLASTPKATTSTKPRRTPQGVASEATPTQTKLAAFGFFNRHSRRMRNNFDKEWDEEDDLELGMDVDEDEEGPTRVPVVSEETPMTGGRLGRVPEAPYHPSLRPAGIRELHRLEHSKLENENENRESYGPASANHNNDSIARPRPVPIQASPHSRTTHDPLESHGSDEQDQPLFNLPSTSSRSSGSGGSGGSGTGLSSSLTTSDADVPRVSEDTKRWWDRIGRSSSGVEQQHGGYDA